MPGVSIVDTRNIIRAIRKKIGYDFSNYALTQFRYRIDDVISRHYIQNPAILINRLLVDTEFFDEFLFEISVPQTEIYRDPEMWIVLREKVFPELTGVRDSFSVWFPDSTDGNDLTSLFFLIEESGMAKKTKLFASSLSVKMIAGIKTAKQNYDIHQPELIRENFMKVNPGSPAEKFDELYNAGSAYRKTIYKSVIFFQQDLNFDPLPAGISLIIFRNKLLNFTPEFQNFIFGKLTDALLPGGFIVTGYKENVENYLAKHAIMEVFDQDENIYRKRFTQ